MNRTPRAITAARPVAVDLRVDGSNHPTRAATTTPIRACPACASDTLVPAESCVLCRECGYSRCG